MSLIILKENFDLNIAVKYLNTLENIFFNLCKYPNIGKNRSDIQFDIYSFVHK